VRIAAGWPQKLSVLLLSPRSTFRFLATSRLERAGNIDTSRDRSAAAAVSSPTRRFLLLPGITAC